MIVIITEKEYQRQRKRVERIKFLVVALPVALAIASGAFAVGFWWSH